MSESDELNKRLEAAEAELAQEKRRLDWAFEKHASFVDGKDGLHIFYDGPDNRCYTVVYAQEGETPRQKIDQLMGE